MPEKGAEILRLFAKFMTLFLVSWIFWLDFLFFIFQ